MQVDTNSQNKRSRPCSNACDACKRRRRKCSGTHPCEYCVGVNKQCVFSAGDKRGPKKAITNPVQQNNIPLPFFMPAPLFATNLPSPYPQPTINTSQTTTTIVKTARIEEITDEPKENNEIVEVVDTHTPFQVAPYKNQIQEFVYVIGLGEIMEVECKSSFEMHQHVLRAQLYSMLASVARHNDDLTKAEILMLEVSKNLKEIFEEPTMDAALAFFCASTYYPCYITKAKFYLSHAWQLAELAPVLTLKDARTKAIIYCLYKLSDNKLSLPARCLDISDYMNNSFTTFGDFEAGFLQFLRLIHKLGQKIDITDANAALQALPTIHFTAAEKSEFLLDFKILECFFATPSLQAFQPYGTALKVVVLWKSGDIAAATEQAILFYRYLETQNEINLMFYCDIIPIMLSVIFFKETNNMVYYQKLGLIAKQIVHRTLSNTYYQFYKDLLDIALPQHPEISAEPPVEKIDDSFVDFLFGNFIPQNAM